MRLLVDNPLLILVIVAAIGYVVGQIKIAGTSIGVAAVLFVGLFFGALDPRLKLPDAIYLLGLVIFVYTVGLSRPATTFRPTVMPRSTRWRLSPRSLSRSCCWPGCGE
jgi:uncharacterized transporter YbjL